MDPQVLLVDTGIALVQGLIGGLKQTSATDKLGEALASGQAFLDALAAHKADLLTKANFEAQRG